jgi:hypothetical protein
VSNIGATLRWKGQRMEINEMEVGVYKGPTSIDWGNLVWNNREHILDSEQKGIPNTKSKHHFGVC